MAGEFGYAHPAQLLDDLTSSQLGELMVYRRLEPPGYQQAWQFAVLASLMYNCSPLRKGRPQKPEQWLPIMLRCGPPQKRQRQNFGAGLMQSMMAMKTKHQGKLPDGHPGHASRKAGSGLREPDPGNP